MATQTSLVAQQVRLQRWTAKKQKEKLEDEIVSKYCIRNTETVVFIETRPKKRFKSQLVQKLNQ